MAAEELGYPVVMKPLVGSWGRLISKVNDREAAEAILEHKDVLGTYMHSIYYVQEYVAEARAGHPRVRRRRRDHRRDLPLLRPLDHQHRARRQGDQLRRDARAQRPLRAGRAGRSAAASSRSMSSRAPRGLLVNEVNYTMEFRNSIDTTGVNIPAKVVDYVLAAAAPR